ncbi:hypothetical protein C4577_06440 [Candidatus Parcubacteria bacterium]|nr:MAG: hypothetical protein C4577_06440 [Candidatus Parcubacteria bacterium]
MITKEQLNLIKQLRETSGLGLGEAKHALEVCNWEIDPAKEYGIKKASEVKVTLPAEGVIATYTHLNRIGAVVHLSCGTDFVANNPEFVELGKQIAQHITASDPKDVPELLTQTYIKDSKLLVSDLINAAKAKFKENIVVEKFERYSIKQKFKSL